MLNKVKEWVLHSMSDDELYARLIGVLAKRKMAEKRTIAERMSLQPSPYKMAQKKLYENYTEFNRELYYTCLDHGEFEAFIGIGQEIAEHLLFKRTMENVVRRCNLATWDVDVHGKKEDYLASIRKMISLDLTASIRAVYAYEQDTADVGKVHLPSMLFNKTHKGSVRLKDTYLFGCPWDDYKWGKLINEKGPLNLGELNKDELPCHLPNLGLLVLGGDNRHRIIEAYTNREETVIPVREVDDLFFLKNYHTDGVYWIPNEGEKDDFEIGNWKLAVIFALRQLELGIADMTKEYFASPGGH